MTATRIVVGVGNEMRQDDAAGLEVARRVRKARIDGVEVKESEGEPTALLDSWVGASEAIVVDAVSSGAEPGEIRRLEAADEPLPEKLFRGSTHALGVGDAIELARALDRLPDRLLVCGIEGERFEAGVGLSPKVEDAVELLARALAKMLAD
jgi:hydrogenase maturation protease